MTNLGEKGVASKVLDKKAKDKELQYHEIPKDDLPLHHEAEEKQWEEEWIRFGSVKPLESAESERIRATVDRKRILRSRFVYRDKHSSLRTPQRDLPVKAKARLRLAGQHCPDCATGRVRTDASTVQRTSTLCFFQVGANLGWLPSLRTGDISAAFLQGTARNTDPIYFEQPWGRGLPGMKPGQLVQVIRGVFGLPDVPRTWWLEFSPTSRSMGLQLDPALMVWRHPSFALGIMSIVRVDDIALTDDGSEETKQIVVLLRKRFRFGYVRNGRSR